MSRQRSATPGADGHRRSAGLWQLHAAARWRQRSLGSRSCSSRI